MGYQYFIYHTGHFYQLSGSNRHYHEWYHIIGRHPQLECGNRCHWLRMGGNGIGHTTGIWYTNNFAYRYCR
jgi:hypothetical protein